MGMIQELEEFAMRGNVMDMAVGVIMGGAFGGIVGSLVKDVLMPVVGVFTGGVDFSGLALKIPTGREGAEPVLVHYGVFVNAVVNFLIVAFCIFMLVKAMNTVMKKQAAAPAPPPEPPAQEKLLAEIRDLLKSR